MCVIPIICLVPARFRLDFLPFFKVLLEYGRVLHDDSLVTDRPHIPQWSHSIMMELKDSHCLLLGERTGGCVEDGRGFGRPERRAVAETPEAK